MSRRTAGRNWAHRYHGTPNGLPCSRLRKAMYPIFVPPERRHKPPRKNRSTPAELHTSAGAALPRGRFRQTMQFGKPLQVSRNIYPLHNTSSCKNIIKGRILFVKKKVFGAASNSFWHTDVTRLQAIFVFSGRPCRFRLTFASNLSILVSWSVSDSR